MTLVESLSVRRTRIKCMVGEGRDVKERLVGGRETRDKCKGTKMKC